MAACVTCEKPLTLLVEDEEGDAQDESMGESGISAGSYVDDDVQLNCGCHFHWSVSFSRTSSDTMYCTNHTSLAGSAY